MPGLREDAPEGATLSSLLGQGCLHPEGVVRTGLRHHEVEGLAVGPFRHEGAVKPGERRVGGDGDGGAPWAPGTRCFAQDYGALPLVEVSHDVAAEVRVEAHR